MEETALLVIDPYNDFISEGGKVWPRISAIAETNSCVQHMLDVLQAARRARLRIFYALHRRYRPGDYEAWQSIAPVQKAAWTSKTFEFGTWGEEIRREFEPQPGDIIASEHWCSSGFANTATRGPRWRSSPLSVLSPSSSSLANRAGGPGRRNDRRKSSSAGGSSASGGRVTRSTCDLVRAIASLEDSILSRGETKVACEHELAAGATGTPANRRNAHDRRARQADREIEPRRHPGRPGRQRGGLGWILFDVVMGEEEVGIGAVEDDDVQLCVAFNHIDEL